MTAPSTPSTPSTSSTVLVAPASARRGRLTFLDALRGIAAALVVAQHIGEQTSASVRSLGEHWLQLGQCGVMVFFLCSGFIIPVSLERHGSLRDFWVARVCRLYPLYWLSLLGAGVLFLLDRFTLLGFTGRHPAIGFAVNATMLQGLVGVPHVIGLYWSLLFEMLFYIGLSVLFVVGLHRRTVLLAVGMAALGVAECAFARYGLHRHGSLGPFNLATMLTGTVLYRAYAGELSARTAARTVGSVLALLVTGLAIRLAGDGDPRALGAASFRPMLFAWLVAYGIVLAGFALRSRDVPRILVRLGVISYSVYLMHALVLVAVPQARSGLLTAVVWIGVTLVLAESTYRLVESPGIALGRRLVRA